MSPKDQLLIWDTETTGLTLHPHSVIAKQPRIIEFGGVLMSLKNGCIMEEISFFIHPVEAISEEITKITGITNAQLSTQPSFRERLPQLRAIFARVGGMVAHNLEFDRAVLGYELEREGVEDFPWPKNEFCTMSMYAPEWGRAPKLKEVYLHLLGKPLEQTHRALDDAMAMAEFIRSEKLWGIMK